MIGLDGGGVVIGMRVAYSMALNHFTMCLRPAQCHECDQSIATSRTLTSNRSHFAFMSLELVAMQSQCTCVMRMRPESENRQSRFFVSFTATGCCSFTHENLIESH